MSPILFFINFFICTGVGKIFLQINSAAVAFIDILIAAWEGLRDNLAYFSIKKYVVGTQNHLAWVATTYGPRQGNLCLWAFRHDKF